MTIFEYSDEITDPPQYLDTEFFETVVENAIRAIDVSIEKVDMKLGSAIGDNYCSTIFRVKLEYRLADSQQCKVLSVIVKCIPQIPGIEFLQELQVFPKERTIFSETLPLMNIFLESNERFGGRLYHSKTKPVNVLAFEDLAVCGFDTASREAGLDLAHCRLVMQRLGNFHAISMHLGKKYPYLTQQYNFGILGRHALKEDSFLYRFFGGNAQALLNLLQNWPEYAQITKKVQKYVDNLPENLRKLQDPRTDEIRVLNHGDLWVNNILFKYDKRGAAQDCIFIDYQMSIWCSPGIDLNYFFYTSLQLDVLQQHRDELLQLYYQHLRKMLLELTYPKIPSYEQILHEVQRHADYGFFANYSIYPIISQDKANAGDSSLDNLADEDFAANKLKQMFDSKQLAKTLHYTLKEFDKLGVWD